MVIILRMVHANFQYHAEAFLRKPTTTAYDLVYLGRELLAGFSLLDKPAGDISRQVADLLPGPSACYRDRVCVVRIVGFPNQFNILADPALTYDALA